VGLEGRYVKFNLGLQIGAQNSSTNSFADLSHRVSYTTFVVLGLLLGGRVGTQVPKTKHWIALNFDFDTLHEK
jgi:hypothetical protein